MKPSTVLNKKRKTIRQITQRYRVTNPRVFGSVLHGTDKDDSDLDLLVDAFPVQLYLTSEASKLS